MFHPIPENDERSNRRHFLHVAGALTVGTTCGPSLLAAAQTEATAATAQSSGLGEPGMNAAPPVQLGILLGTFAQPTLEGKLDAVRACGLDCVQLSLDCAGLPAMPEEISGRGGRRDSPQGGGPWDNDCLGAGHLQHEPP